MLYLDLGAQAQQRTALDELFYPHAQQEQMVYSSEQKVYVQFSDASVAQILSFYLRLSRQPDWQLIFPSEIEARAWLAGLGKSGEPPVFMLNLYHLKSKVNYNLTIGAYPGTRELAAQSIITLYSTRHPFGGVREDKRDGLNR